MYILGLNCAYHESSVCLLKDGKLVAFAEEERFNRKKHAKQARVDNPNELPLNAISYCLKKAGIGFADVDYVGFSLNPKERLEKNICHQHPYTVVRGDFGTKEGETLFYEKTISAEERIRLLGFKGKFHYLNHHDCHAASSFFVSPFDSAAVLVIDGIGEFESTTSYYGEGNSIRKIQSIAFPNSLGFLWEKLSKFMGFNEYDASKVMGLASYGDPVVYREHFATLVKVNTDGAFAIDDSIIQFRNENYSGLEQLFGLEKRHDSIMEVDTSTFCYANLAASLQQLTEEIVVELAKTLKEKTGSKNLCLSGGVALNCVANGRLLEKKIFYELFILPAANDAGTALGAAFYVWNQLLGNNRTYVFDSAFLGPSFTSQEIRESLDARCLTYEEFDDVERKAAELLAAGKIVAWFQGAVEVGPRALGNRSILCDPRSKNAVALLNQKVKRRESFRPLCPSVLADKATDWFEISSETPSAAKYMLCTFNVLDDRKDLIPAVTHVDGTARIQAVEKHSNPRFYHLIEEFEKLTGVPVLLNTSFNVQEPIVCSPEDALNTFLKSGIDFLAIGNFLVCRNDNLVTEFEKDLPLKEYFEGLR